MTSCCSVLTATYLTATLPCVCEPPSHPHPPPSPLSFSLPGFSNLEGVNLQSERQIFTLGAGLYNGLSVPAYFESYTAANGHGPIDTSSTTFNNIFNTIFSTPAAISLITTMLLDLTIPAAPGERTLEVWQRQLRWAVWVGGVVVCFWKPQLAASCSRVPPGAACRPPCCADQAALPCCSVRSLRWWEKSEMERVSVLPAAVLDLLSLEAPAGWGYRDLPLPCLLAILQA